MKITIVMPTYNESDNIARMIDALELEFKKAPEDSYEILVVEGNSPDGTAKIVEQKAIEYSNVHLLLEEKKAGLGAAYIYGFKYAINTLNADVLVEMDADFQRDPKDITRLVAPLHNGYDYVIGSRFTKGGSIPEELSFYRKFLSVGGNIFSKIDLGIWKVNDFTSGFKAARVKGYVDRMTFDDILTKGFAYKINLLFKMHRLGAKIYEIPIAFGLRDRGISKMENNNASDSLKVVLLLRYNENKNFFKFIIVGFTGLFVDSILFNLLRISVFSSDTASFTSGLVAMTTTFLLNNYWSFKEHKIESITGKIKGIVIYYISSTFPILVRSQLILFANHTFGDNFLVSNIAFFIGVVFGLVWNFTVYSKIIWKKKP